MRYLSIDFLRMLAIVLMVAVHFAENLAATYSPAAAVGVWAKAAWALGDLAASLFTFLLGVSYRIWVWGRELRGEYDEKITKTSIRRGLFLFCLGFAFNALVWLPEDTFNWDVLTLLGVAMIVLALTRAAPPGVHLFTAAAVAIVSPALREICDYSSFWAPGYFDPDLTLSDVGLGFLCAGYFPVFPWVAYPLFGYASAEWIYSNRDEQTSVRSIVGGAGLVTMGVATLIVSNSGSRITAWLDLGGWSMYPPTFAYVLLTLGAILIALPLAHRQLDYGCVNQQLVTIAGRFSRHALTIYLLHHAIHLWPLWAWGAATAEDPTEHWRKAMPTSAALGLAALFIVAVYPLLCWMDQTGWRGIEGWMRWLCEDDPAPGSSDGRLKSVA